MDAEIRLEPYEARVLGVLVEKALTTPEQYPLTLNAVVNGANQKTNREPLLALSDDEVSEALDGLIDKELARKVFPGSSRVDKFCHTGTSTLKVEIAQLALLVAGWTVLGGSPLRWTLVALSAIAAPWLFSPLSNGAGDS
jgi:uncharacterized protein YceH (UPF0502 family)